MVDVDGEGAPRAKPFRSLMAAIPGARVEGDGDPLVTAVTEDSRRGYSRRVVRGGARGDLRWAGFPSRGRGQGGGRGGGGGGPTTGTASPSPASAIGLVPDPLAAMAPLACAFYDYPGARLTLVGVTGTNGKTTTALMIEAMWRAAQRTTGVVGTLEYRIGEQRRPAPHTTPKALDLQRLLAEMVAAGVTHAAMEVSSHALALHRVHGCRFAGAVFTNLTQDHLDFHGDMRSYFEAKQRLFTEPEYFPEEGSWVNVLNGDDPAGEEMAATARGRTLLYGLTASAEARAEEVVLTPQGTRFTAVLPCGRAAVAMQPVGRFNVYNTLAALAVVTELGLPLEEAAAGLEGMAAVRGRFERVASPVRDIFIDYAHTPDGLQKALESARQFTRGRIVVVFGCGGDRDRTKRPVMGELASRLADRCVSRRTIRGRRTRRRSWRKWWREFRKSAAGYAWWRRTARKRFASPSRARRRKTWCCWRGKGTRIIRSWEEEDPLR